MSPHRLLQALNLPVLEAGRVSELMPGDVAFGKTGDQFRTLLGSCVSVILTDRRRTAAAMCHIVHVHAPNASNRSNTAYGSVAMNLMFERLLKEGVMPQRCEAYVAGGGNMFPEHTKGQGVGSRNVAWVQEFLQKQGIAVVGSSVLGRVYRRVSWTVGEGEPTVELASSETGIKV